MIYGVTQEGFVRKTYQEILEERQARARQLFGDDVDLADESPIGIFVKLIAWDADKLWQLAEDVYYSLQLEDAEGIHLDKIVDIGLVNRIPAQKALVELTFTGAAAVEIPVGTLTESISGRVYATLTTVCTANSGVASVWAQDTTAGAAGNVAAQKITTIKTPLAGIDGVTNPAPATGGRNSETDVELKRRYHTQRSATGNTRDAIETALRAVDSVIAVSVWENDTGMTDEEGCPPYSLEAVVWGGLSSQIGEAIYKKKPAGVESFGSERVYVAGAGESLKAICFSRPSVVNVYVRLKITPGVQWQHGYIGRIKKSLVALIGGYDDAGAEYSGLGLGGKLNVWEIFALLSRYQGIEGAQVFCGLSLESMGTDNIQFKRRELPRITTANVEVELLG